MNRKLEILSATVKLVSTLVAELLSLTTLGECIALWGEPNELSIQYRSYIFIQYV